MGNFSSNRVWWTVLAKLNLMPQPKPQGLRAQAPTTPGKHLETLLCRIFRWKKWFSRDRLVRSIKSLRLIMVLFALSGQTCLRYRRRNVTGRIVNLVVCWLIHEEFVKCMIKLALKCLSGLMRIGLVVRRSSLMLFLQFGNELYFTLPPRIKLGKRSSQRHDRRQSRLSRSHHYPESDLAAIF